MTILNNSNYAYVIFEEDNGYKIMLWLKTDTSRVKTFFIANKEVSPLHIREHMDSLTDQQCSDYLKGIK